MRLRRWKENHLRISLTGIMMIGIGSATCFAQIFQTATALNSNSGETLPDAPGASSQTDVSSASPRTPPAATTPDGFPSRSARGKRYLYELVGPGAFIGPAIITTIDQVRGLNVGYPNDGYPYPGYKGPEKHPTHGAPPEWGQGMGGFSKRYASNFGMGMIGTTTRYGLGELLRQDVAYHPCTCTGVMPRTVHAVTQSFVAHTRSGKAVLSVPAIVAPFVAAESGVAGWYPSRFSVSDSLRISGNFYIGLPIGNLIGEFTGK
ncbi:hypothetical protein [Granulicella aggregans]|nr:hypothetical protein [Granulicella aggregans]